MASPTSPTYLDVQIQGLYLNPSTFGNNAPPGSLSQADDVVIDRPSVVATRRGFDNSFSTLMDDGIRSLMQYDNVMIMNTTDNDLHYDPAGDGTFILYDGSYYVPDPSNPASRIRSIESNQNLYFVTQDGTYRLDHPTGQPRLAGAPPGLSGTGVTTGTTGFLASNTAVAYRVVFGYTDYNQQLVLGAPSSRIIVQNTSVTAANVTVTFQQPKEIQSDPTDFIYQVYRGNASPNLTTDPDDEMTLIYEDVCPNTATVTINDITPVALATGAALYTNQGQNGITQAQYRPPWAYDICTFKQYAFYANTRTLQNANATLISAGASNGVDAMVPGDTVTFTDLGVGATFTLTADTSNNFTTGHFAVSNTGNPAFDIQTTASNICLVANAYASNTFLSAYYISGTGDLPGIMNFTRLTLTPDAFNITVSNSNSWEQAMPITSLNDVKPNRIYYSVFNQPDAVPLVNYIDVGSANQPINRILPLRNGVIVMKQDGVFLISNNAPPFTITPIDYNVRILADNTADQLDNYIYFLSNQGVVAFSDTSGQIMSFVLDSTILENTSPTLFPNLQEVAWGIAYQSGRKYILSLPTSASDTQAQHQYVYSYLTQVWTHWTRSTSCGIVFNKDDKLYLGSLDGSAPGTNNNYLYQERKTYTNNDYADNQYTTTTSTVGPSNVITVVTPSLPNDITLLAGWTVLQSSVGASARIVSYITVGSVTTITLDTVQTWEAGDVVIYTPVYSTVRTIQLDCLNPGMNKQYTDIVYIFTEQGFTQLTANLSSNTSGNPVTDYIVPNIQGGWGIDPWGTTPWGGNPSGQGKVRRYVPQALQRSGWIYMTLSNAQAFTSFGWSGIQLFYKQTSSRQF